MPRLLFEITKYIALIFVQIQLKPDRNWRESCLMTVFMIETHYWQAVIHTKNLVTDNVKEQVIQTSQLQRMKPECRVPDLQTALHFQKCIHIGEVMCEAWYQHSLFHAHESSVHLLVSNKQKMAENKFVYYKEKKKCLISICK